MEIQDLNEITDHTIRRAADNYEMESGELLRIFVDDGFVLDTEVPEGKQWEINIMVHIIERNEN